VPQSADHASEALKSADQDESTQFLDFPLSQTPTEAEQAAEEFFEPTQFFDFTKNDPAVPQVDPSSTQFYDFSQNQPVAEPPLSEPGVAAWQPPAETAAVDPLLRYRQATPQEEEPSFEDEPLWDDMFPLQEARTRKKSMRWLSENRTLKLWITVGFVIGLVVLVAAISRVFIVETFVITSNSLSPALESGDRILVNKLAYTFGDVGRGDLVVFDRPENDPTISKNDLIKRVVALENETIQFINGLVYIGEQLLVEPYLKRGQETLLLPDGRLFEACVNQTRADVCQIAPGHVFVMGDNRSSSFDSRFFGPIPENLIVGRADFRLWPLGDLGLI